MGVCQGKVTDADSHADTDTFDLEDVQNIANAEELYFELARNTHWKQHQVRMLHAKYKRLQNITKEDDPKDKGFTSKTFLEKFMKLIGITDEAYAKSVFKLFDINKNKHVTFTEFTSGLSVICEGSWEDRLDFVFHSFDRDHDNLLSIDDVKLLASTCPDALDEPDCVDKLIKDSSLSSDQGQVTLATFKDWAQECLEIEALLKPFQILPTILDERDTIKKLMNEANMELGSTWYLLSSRWWQSWKDYVGYDVEMVDPARSMSKRDLKSSSLKRSISTILSPRPVSIDNSELQGDSNGEIKKGLEENVDFVLVCEDVWNELTDWYGGGPAYPRKVIEMGAKGKQIKQVELYPLFLTICECSAAAEPDEKDTTLKVSCQLSFDAFEQQAKAALEVDEKEEVRLWLRESGGWKLMNTSLLGEPRILSPPASPTDDSNVSEAPQSPSSISLQSISPESCSQSEVTVYTLDDFDLESGDTVMVERKLASSSIKTALDIKPKSNLPAESWPMQIAKDYGRVSHEIKFEVGATLDACDKQGKWYRSVIRKVKAGAVFVHFEGWSEKWNEWIDESLVCECRQRCTCRARMAPLNTQSKLAAAGKRKTNRVGDEMGSPVHRGVSGLANLGNTCFMNSTVQCLSNTPIASTFFTSGRYKKDINKHNPLGNKGQLATEFAHLLKLLWSGSYKSVAPRDFKRAISKFAPQFAGHQQHDGQELLAFLLDGLHEDLNRVKKKPYTQSVEDKGRPDDVVSKEAWETHLRRNRSVIVDLFMAQLKSTVTCPKAACGKVSVTFDPYMFLPLPLPIAAEKRLKITVVPALTAGGGSVSHATGPQATRPILYELAVDKRGLVEDLKDVLEQRCGIDAAQLILCDVYKGTVYRVLDDSHAVSSIRSNDVLIAFEETTLAFVSPEEEDNTEFAYIQVATRLIKTWDSGDRALSNLFAFPYVLTLPESATNRQIYELVEANVKMWCSVLPSTHSDKLDSANITKYYSLRYSTPAFDKCRLCDGSECGGLGCEIPNNDELARLSAEDSVVILWEGDGDYGYMPKLYKQACNLTHVSSEHRKSSKQTQITIYDCLDRFTKAEVLGKSEAWYCSDCKEHRQAHKKLDIYSAPEILIVQLKRFQQVNQVYREKITSFVDFPVKGLDLSPYLLSKDCVPVYDLFAVTNHHGATGGGHYTAYCRNLDDMKWYLFDDSRTSEVNVSKVKSNAAYVLFYRRRH